ncbi:hypothetical protein CVT24_008624 [Panaeolus cyanescens]|uniref:Major facilitator superfamily (MFS) profile domain-containing protein n=1 Tax=Panaeolus cyanescens TaxID=181874 RepID=A0A409VB82_9AGAR|nr:hypothetical protein CVT24_008624 [Panaeolus cyanescens]
MGTAPAISGPPQSDYHTLVKQTRPWYKNPRLVVLNGWICLLLITSSTSGYDGSMINGLQSVQDWEEFFNFPKGGKLGLFNAIQNIGSLCAYPFAPYVTDGLGRRSTIWLGAAIMVIATIIQTAAQNFGMFVGARAAWTTFGTFRIDSNWSWRIPSALQALPSVIQVLLIWLIPESPRWLVGKGREDEALKTLAYYHADGDENHPLVQYEFEEIRAAIAFDRDVAANVGWLSLIKTPGNRRRLRIIIALAFFSQWSGNGLGSYYLNKVLSAIGITSPNTQLLINGILSIWSCLVAVTAGFLCERAGRRPLFLSSCAGKSLIFFGTVNIFLICTTGLLITWTLETVCFAVYSQNGNVQAGHAVVAMMFLFSFAYNVSCLFSLDCLLYRRNPSVPDSRQRLYGLQLRDLVVVDFQSRSLEETAALFDGDSAVAMLAEKAARNAGLVKRKGHRDSGDTKEKGGEEEQIE